jgi:H+/Cl- antiporter ClcA
LFVAIIAGLAGAGMSVVILKIMTWKSKFKNFRQHLLFLFASAMILASLTYFVSDYTMGSGKELMTDILFTTEKHNEWYLPLVRLVGPIGSFTTGAAGGIFAPSLSTGASIGATIAGLFDLSASNTNLLVLAGMVAFLTGVTRSPFTSAMLVLEMTDRHSLIFHLMAAAMVSNLFALLVDRKSFYDHLKDRFVDDLQFLHKSAKREDLGLPPESVEERD